MRITDAHAQPVTSPSGWTRPPTNAPRVILALTGFGAPMADITQGDFARPGVVFQIGVATAPD